MTWNVKWFGVTGGTDDTPVFQRAIDLARDLGGGDVFVPAGTYILNGLRLYSNITLRGSSAAASILKQKVGAQYVVNVNPFGEAPLDPAHNQKNICVRDFTCEGRSDLGFFESRHLLNLNGVTNVLIERCRFLSPQGDGIYIGSSNVAGQEAQNLNVIIRDCYFDGVNFQNRNGISIIDCIGCWIENCYFTRLSRYAAPGVQGMPGAIDIEPDAHPFHRIKCIRILNNRFVNIGGNVGAISVVLASRGQVTMPPEDIIIAGNSIEDVVTGIFISQDGLIMPPSPVMQIQVIANSVKGASGRPFHIAGVRWVRLKDNSFADCGQDPIIAGPLIDHPCEDIELSGNFFHKISTVSGSGLQLFAARRLALTGNLFLDIGDPPGSANFALDFNRGGSENVRFEQNLFLSPASITDFAIQKEPAHNLTASSNIYRDNQIVPPLAGNAFLNDDTVNRDIEYESGSWTPVLRGSSTAGSNTYSAQDGTYVRLGKSRPFASLCRINR